jgi:hypothetical protein
MAEPTTPRTNATVNLIIRVRYPADVSQQIDNFGETNWDEIEINARRQISGFVSDALLELYRQEMGNEIWLINLEFYRGSILE